MAHQASARQAAQQVDKAVLTVDRRYLELCVLSCAMIEIKSGDLCMAGSERFSDCRDRLVPWDEYERQIATYSCCPSSGALANGPLQTAPSGMCTNRISSVSTTSAMEAGMSF